MREWLPLREEYLSHIIALEAPPDGRRCGKCGVSDGDWRCLECFGRPVYCTDCLQLTHRRMPLHRVEKWADGFFEPAWLREVGVRMHLGHNGEPCIDAEFPTAGLEREEDEDGEDEDMSDAGDNDENEALPASESASPPSHYACDALTIVDVTGIHSLDVVWCRCVNGATRDVQLLDMGLYPGSTKRPRTAFTFRVLDDYLLTNKECKTSGMNYYSKLRRVTNSAFPYSVQVSPRQHHGCGDANHEETGSLQRAAAGVAPMAKSEVSQMARVWSWRWHGDTCWWSRLGVPGMPQAWHKSSAGLAGRPGTVRL